MTRDEVYARLKDVFADVFDREVPLSDATTAAAAADLLKIPTCIYSFA